MNEQLQQSIVRRTGAVVLGLGVVALLAVQGCAMMTSTEEERQIGGEVAREVKATMGFTEDPKVQAYVKELGSRLAQQSPRQDVPYEFHVVEMREPNAFALPGGFVYVSRGLLAITNSEDELAGVIGHEIGHVVARHSIKRMSRAAPFAIVGGITGAVTGIVSENLSQAFVGLAGALGSITLAPYSRGQEREADEIGIEMAGAAGWDPAALSGFLHTLQREEELQLGGPRETSFLDTHPATPERVSDTAKHAKEIKRGPARRVTADRAGFLAKLDGLVVGNDPAQGIFVETLFLHPDLDFAVQFPTAWKTGNSPQGVGAVQPDQRAIVVLQPAGEGSDPMAAPRALERKLKEKDSRASLMDKVERFDVNGLPAARLVVPQAGIYLAWIAHKGLLYQVGGQTADPKEFATYRPAISDTVQSFRPLTSAERSGIQVAKLRIIRAREGETLDQLIARSGSAWNVQEAAVANGLQSDTRLKDGQLVKIAKDEAYRPRGRR